jgi:hypothetical protein
VSYLNAAQTKQFQPEEKAHHPSRSAHQIADSGADAEAQARLRGRNLPLHGQNQSIDETQLQDKTATSFLRTYERDKGLKSVLSDLGDPRKAQSSKHALVLPEAGRATEYQNRLSQSIKSTTLNPLKD